MQNSEPSARGLLRQEGKKRTESTDSLSWENVHPSCDITIYFRRSGLLSHLSGTSSSSSSTRMLFYFILWTGYSHSNHPGISHRCFSHTSTLFPNFGSFITSEQIPHFSYFPRSSLVGRTCSKDSWNARFDTLAFSEMNNARMVLNWRPRYSTCNSNTN